MKQVAQAIRVTERERTRGIGRRWSLIGPFETMALGGRETFLKIALGEQDATAQEWIAGFCPDRDQGWVRGRMALMLFEGDDVKKTVAVQLAGPPGEGRKRLAEAGLTVSAFGPKVTVSAVRFGSRARKSGFEQGFQVSAVKVPTDRPSEHWVYIPALALVAFIWFLQGARTRGPRKKKAVRATA